MNTGIDIVYFEPGAEPPYDNGRLYLDIEGRNYFERKGSLKDILKPFKIMYAMSEETGRKYTLINFQFHSAKGDTYRYIVLEVYNNEFLEAVTKENCIETEFEFSGLTEWINNSRISKTVIKDGSKVAEFAINKSVTNKFQISETLSLEFLVYGGFVYDRHTITLTDYSCARIISSKSLSRQEIYQHTEAFLKFVTLFTETLPKFTRLWFTFDNLKTIEYLSVKKQIKPEMTILLTRDKIGKSFETMLNLFYERKQDYLRVINLLIESVRNKTPEISFLNITTAFEVFHKTFLESKDENIRLKLAEELEKAMLVPKKPKNWDNITRYLHIFKAAGTFTFVKQFSPDIYKMIGGMRASRNYYTHYNLLSKSVWQTKELMSINIGLLQILKSVILIELNLDHDTIDRFLMSNGSLYFNNTKENEYSLFFGKNVDR